MQVTIDIDERAVDKVMYILQNLKRDVKIISTGTGNNDIFETIDEEDPDFFYIKEARDRREKGEKLYDIDDIIDEFQ